MAHYAVLNSSNEVTGVLTGKNENDTDTLPSGYDDWADYYSQKICGGATVLRTSYNTQNGVHELGGTPFRGNFASVGMIYDEDNDVFIEKAPEDDWTLNTTTWNWEAP